MNVHRPSRGETQLQLADDPVIRDIALSTNRVYLGIE